MPVSMYSSNTITHTGGNIGVLFFLRVRVYHTHKDVFILQDSQEESNSGKGLVQCPLLSCDGNYVLPGD